MNAAGLVREVARRFVAARLTYGHGTANARDEAAWLVGHALGMAPGELALQSGRPVTARELGRVDRIAGRRIRERVPLAYLLGEAWMGDVRFLVDRRVIVPRSFIGELLGDGIDALLARTPRSALDLCTGSGCLGILVARAYPRCRVDVADVSAAALQVARRNVALHRLGRRVRPHRSDLFDGLPARRYDLIVANPPYVDAASMRALPAEYRREPVLALAGGPDGLDLVRRILRGAPARLAPRGLLVCEIGHNRRALERACPRAPFTWLDTSAGDRFVFAMTREELAALA